MNKLNALYERILPLGVFNEIIKNNLTIITIKSDEERNNRIFDLVKYNKKIIVEYSMESITRSTTNSTIKDTVLLSIDNEDGRKYNPFGFSELENFVSLLKDSKNDILIDITGISIRFLGMLLSGIKDVLHENRNALSKIFCGYTEPNQYRKNSLVQMFGSVLNSNGDISNFEFLKKFNLYNLFASVEPIPHLESIGSTDNKKQIWIVLLGFEGERPDRIHEELTRVDEIVALITVPSLRPGWSNYAFDENAHFLEGINNEKPMIDYISAISPFTTYNYLCSMQNDNPECRLLISPLGTKATSLGAILFAINNPECSLVFDNPFETPDKRSNSFGKSYFFDITEALKCN